MMSRIRNDRRPFCFLPQLLRTLCAVFVWHSSFSPATTVTLLVHAGPLQFQCDPCVDRSQLEIHAVVHGTSDDVSWIQAKKAMQQASVDMGVQFQLELRATFSSVAMAAEIRSLIRYELDDSDHGHSHAAVPQIDGLIVTIPDQVVHAAVEDAMQAGIHVFGFHAGYQHAQQQDDYYDDDDNNHILGYVAQDEFAAGALAAFEFRKRRLEAFGDPETAIFVNHNGNSSALKERFRGFNETLYQLFGIEAEEMVVEPRDFYDMILQVDTMMKACQYDFVLLSGAEVVPSVSAAFEHHLCDDYFEHFSKEVIANGTIDVPDTLAAADLSLLRPMMIASFDDTEAIWDAIVLDRIRFTLSPQKYLMSVLPVIFSTIYASTGKKLELPFSGSIYRSGPKVIDIDNIPSDTLLVCQQEAFPICNKDGTPTQTICPCINRKSLRIAGVVHGVEGSRFWDEIFAAAKQAGHDMDVTLELERFEPQESDAVLHNKMSARIRSLCGSGVDGIFVSMPSERLTSAVRFCRQLRVPVVNINAGWEFALTLGVQHIGQQETEAGRQAGRRMVEAGIIEGYCIVTGQDNVAVNDRCKGFGDTLNSNNATYGGIIMAPSDNELQYYQAVAAAVGGDNFDSWDGIGLIITGGPIESALHVQGHHQGAKLGVFDVREELFEALNDGRILFAVDQQQQLQGSMAVYLLSYAAITKQTLLNEYIETGPTMVESSPSDAEQICEEKHYEVCSRVPQENYNLIDKSWLAGGYAAVALVCFTSLVCLVWMHVYRLKNVVKASQPLFLGLLVCGAIISILSILAIGAQTEYRYLKDPMTGELTDEPNPDVALVDAACIASPWLYGIGFAIIFSALCAKIHRVKKIFDAGSAMRKKKVEVKDVMIVMAVMLTGEIAILLCWSIIDPPKWERVVKQESGGYVLESSGRCQSDPSDIFYGIQMSFHAVCLLYALLLCWRTADIPTEFSEGSYVSLSVLCIFQVSILAIPIGYMVEDTPNVFYFVRSASVFLQTFTVLCLIFCPKMYRVYTGDDQLPLAHVRRRTGGQNTTTQDGYGGNSTTPRAISSSVPASTNSIFSQQSTALPSRTSLDSTSNKPGTVQESAPVNRMAPVDSHSDEEDQGEFQATPAISPNDAYTDLKAGLDAEISSSSSTSSEPPDPEALAAGASLASLAAEISRAEEVRAEVLSSSQADDGAKSKNGASAPSNEDALESINPRETTANESDYASNMPLVAPNTRQFNRQDLPHIDSSVESSSNDDASTNAVNDALQVAGVPFESQESPDCDGNAESSSADVGWRQNPQEGSQASHSSTAKIETALDADHQIESESTSTTGASTQGISKAEASRAEIFRMPCEQSEHTDIPIRLKKEPQAYGENAALAMGITKASGSFLRKVAASFGSMSVASSTARQTSLVESKSTLPVQLPAHRMQKKAPVDDRPSESSGEFQVERQNRPLYAALKRSVTEDEDDAAGVASKIHEADTPSQAKTDGGEGKGLYFL